MKISLSFILAVVSLLLLFDAGMIDLYLLYTNMYACTSMYALTPKFLSHLFLYMALVFLAMSYLRDLEEKRKQ